MINLSDLAVGNTVRVVPSGALCDVSYNENGVICNVVVNGTEVSSSFSVTLQKANVFPSRISRKSRTTVSGVLCLDEVDVKSLSTTTPSDEVVERISVGNVSDVKFKSFWIDSSSNMPYGAYQQTTVMKMLGFDPCQSFVVGPETSESAVHKYQSTMGYPFVSGFYVIRNNGSDNVFVPCNVVFSTVKSVSRYFTRYGYVVSDVECSDAVVTVPYTSVVRYNVQKGSVVGVDDGRIVFGSDRRNLSKKVDREFRCPYCGSKINVPLSGYVQCSYENCVSRLYSQVLHFCKTLDLPSVPYSEYSDAVREKQFMSMCDVFDLPTLTDVTVTCPPSTLLRSLCPVSVRVTDDFFDKFVEAAGSVDALMYYLENVEKIQSDLIPPLTRLQVASFSRWLSESENVLVLKEFINSDKVSLVKNSTTLNVPKIFRNKTIYLEGRFRHGSYLDVCSILRSYGAEIASKFDNRCDCVIVGDVSIDNVGTSVVEVANSYNVPVFQEGTFFTNYDIDKDIDNAKNHL